MSQEIVTVEQSRALDRASAEAGVTTRTLMENAGRAVAEAVVGRFSQQPTAVLCGPGNNGGDGWVAARALREMGWPVWVEALAPIESLTDDAADAAKAWTGETFGLGQSGRKAELWVDALFGAGLSRPLENEVARLAVVLPQERVIAIDVPSGVKGDDGNPLGDVCFEAALTITFARKKPAHVLMPGRAWCGEVVVADIGVPARLVAAQNVTLFENAPLLWPLPWPDADTHKHERGHVIVASGNHTRTGAARLSARAALRGGAGLVTLLSPPDAVAENAAQLTAVMLRETIDETSFGEAARTAQAMVVGPAFGTTEAHYKLLLAAMDATPRCPLVLDADAITLLAPLTHGLDARDVMTPHVGEFRRAFPGIWGNSTNPVEAARSAAAYARCVVLLKGASTVIAAPDGRAIVNTKGTPFLATAGSGDVLAGVIGALIGQGMASFEAAAAAAWIHGAAGEVYGPGLIAEDLPDILPLIFNALAPAGLRGKPVG
ncbi:MAG: NAD(P)H-hydrate dehydratase [Hyphomonadaceae bacterium]